MSVVIGFEDAGPWRKKVTVEVPQPAVDAEIGRVVQDLARSIRLPGFRRGKVPAALVLKRFPDEIEHRLAERLVPRYWHQAEAEKNLDPLTPPRFEDVHIEKGQPMTFVAVVETRPEIELGPLDDFDLPAGSTEPGEDEIADAQRDLLRQHASWEPVERPAAIGDLVIARATEIAAEAPETTQPAATPIQVELGGDGVDEELTLALTGLSAGQSTEITRHRGEGDEARDVRHRIEVQEVREQHLPELDDAFAARFELASADALREGIGERLRIRKRIELQQRREEALLKQLRERHPLELPTGLVDQETERLMRESATHLHAQGVDVEKAAIDWEQMARQLKPRAEARVHSRLLLDAVAKAKGLKLDEAEFERVLKRMAQQQNRSSLSIRQELSEGGRLQGLRADLLAQQTVRHLLGEDVPAAASPSQDPESPVDESQTDEEA